MFTRFLPLWVYGDFSGRSGAAGSAVLGPIWPGFELVRDVVGVLVACGYDGDPIGAEGAGVFTTFSPLWPCGGCQLSWALEFPSDLARGLVRPFPHPGGGSDRVSLRLARWIRGYSGLRMFVDTQTDTQAQGHAGKLPFGSGDLKT